MRRDLEAVSYTHLDVYKRQVPNCWLLVDGVNKPKLWFYLPKTQAWQEAAWWNDVFSFTEDRFDLPREMCIRDRYRPETR